MNLHMSHLRAERRAAPKPACIPWGDRSPYSAGEESSSTRAAPKPAGVPSGDRLRYAADEGSS